MATISDTKLDLIKKLYYRDLMSARMIGDELGVSIDAVFHFMRKHKIKRRNLSE